MAAVVVEAAAARRATTAVVATEEAEVAAATRAVAGVDPAVAITDKVETISSLRPGWHLPSDSGLLFFVDGPVMRNLS